MCVCLWFSVAQVTSACLFPLDAVLLSHMRPVIRIATPPIFVRVAASHTQSQSVLQKQSSPCRCNYMASPFMQSGLFLLLECVSGS